MSESKELKLLLEAGGFDIPLASLIQLAIQEKPKVVKFGDDTSYNWNALSVVDTHRPAPMYFHVLREDPLALVLPRQGENIPYILPTFTRVWNVYKPQRLDVSYDIDNASFTGNLVLTEPAVAIKIDVLTPWNVTPSAIPVLTMVTAEVDKLPPVNRVLEEKFKRAEKDGNASEMFQNLVKHHKPEEFLDKYIEYTGWRNQYVFIGYITRLHKDTNPWTGKAYYHASLDVGIISFDAMISTRWEVSQGDRVKGIGLLEMWLEG